MNEMENNKLNDEMLENVTGGKSRRVSVKPITPKWVVVTSSSLNCRYSPDGEIAKIYEKGHRLKVDGITTDGLWYRLWIYDPRGGECYGYIYKQYTRNESHEPYSYG